MEVKWSIEPPWVLLESFWLDFCFKKNKQWNSSNLVSLRMYLTHWDQSFRFSSGFYARKHPKNVMSGCHGWIKWINEHLCTFLNDFHAPEHKLVLWSIQKVCFRLMSHFCWATATVMTLNEHGNASGWTKVPGAQDVYVHLNIDFKILSVELLRLQSFRRCWHHS